MKTVFKSHEIAHIWASQTQSEGRTAGSSMSFRGRDFFSYRTVIARILDDGSIAIATKRYSATTDKHLSSLRYAFNHKTVHHISSIDYPESLLYVCELERQELYKKASCAVTKKDYYLAQAHSLAVSLNDYLAVIGHAKRAPINPDVDLVAIKQATREAAAIALARKKERAALASLRNDYLAAIASLLGEAA